MIDLGAIDVPCPLCVHPVRVFVEGRDLGAQDGAHRVGVSASRDLLDLELEQHFAEHHSDEPGPGPA